MYANPAGMTRLSGNQLVVGGQMLCGKADYEPDGTGLLGAGDPGNSDPSRLVSGEYKQPYMVFLSVHYSQRF